MGQQLISSKQLGGGLSSESCFIITYALGRQIHLLKRLFLTGQIMQIRSRDLVPPKTRRRSLSKNGYSLQKEGLDRKGTGQVLMTTAKELCLAIVECFIDFKNKLFLLLVPSPPIKVICLFKSFSVSISTFPSAETMYLMALKS